MYLKSIKSHGFKSFADKTEINLKPGVTGIVGPNGSGKSNIVDAVKWVLGEQSSKTLRASGMSDVIFAGSKTREPMNRAYVSLTFDNSDKYLNTEFNNVEIKRVLYKTGENEYFINNSKVRLKDITDLFIDSGAGKESFNIISQGAVSDIINSKAEDRRVIFESASGVLKYKKRKEETNRKLLKVKDNLEKIKLVINELEDNRNNLREQANIAQNYLNDKQDLEKIEIALIAKDITDINELYQNLKDEVATLNKELEESQDETTADTSKIESLKLENLKIDEKIAKLNDKVLSLSNEIATLNNKKELSLERQKYDVNENVLQTNIVSLKEEVLNFQKNINSVKKEIALKEEELKKYEKDYNLLLKEYESKTLKKEECNNKLIQKNKDNLNILNQIEILEANILNDEKLPYAVKCVLNNPRLEGIHNTIGKLLDIPSKYSLAIDTALGYSANIIVSDNEIKAKEAINYLKANKLGRATFFPLNIIKERKIDEEVLEQLKQMPGFVGIAVNLVKYNPSYHNIMANQLGNIIVTDNIDSLNKIGKKINYRYKIVTLDGEILHTGGALSGGVSKYSSNSVIMQKEKLTTLKSLQTKINKELETIKTKQESLEKENTTYQQKILFLTRKLADIKENINQKNISLENLRKVFEDKNNELERSLAAKENRLDSEINELLETLYEKQSKLELTQKELNNLKDKKNDLFLEISDLEKLNKGKTNKYNEKLKELNTKEVKIGKLDVQLDNLLNTLNETYNMTYEKALKNYSLEIDEATAREKVVVLKRKMQNYGNVNTGAIEEFKRIDERYTFLENQKNDLENSIVNLNEVINEMDHIMIKRFSSTFKKVSDEFEIVFKKLFKGGKGKLKLTDEEDMLNTGVEIIAEPPGKKLNTIGLLSGGEKTLTAIALLFAILNVNPVPFVILDEVEAALDEANVLTFGKYLIEKKEKSQYIIITHKKKTMEYADVLYGITMQESGISKLVSVKLENM